jgi:glycosyltransferase involved in cell wall biosynthesis
MNQSSLISVVVPIYNEALNLPTFYDHLHTVFDNLEQKYQLIFVNDGSTDDSASILDHYSDTNQHIQVLHLSRNFGKEVALTAGLNHATGNAAIMLDADLQHPPKFIPEFISKWQNGADVVIGVRTESGKESRFHKIASVIYYKILSTLSDVPIVPHATDFRLIDRQVIDQFARFTEHNRMLRGLIDWLGFERDYVYFAAQKRHAGQAAYGTRQLIKLAMNSFVSMSLAPLKFATWLGTIIIVTAGPLGLFIAIDKFLFHNPHHFTGVAGLSVLVIFLVGIMLIGLGIIGLYIAGIHSEVSNRPLYVIRANRKGHA